jgi:hypothetical protein
MRSSWLKLCASQSASGESSTEPRTGRHTLTTPNRWFLRPRRLERFPRSAGLFERREEIHARAGARGIHWALLVARAPSHGGGDGRRSSRCDAVFPRSAPLRRRHQRNRLEGMSGARFDTTSPLARRRLSFSMDAPRQASRRTSPISGGAPWRSDATRAT